MKRLEFLFSCFALASLALASPGGFTSARVGANSTAGCNLSWQLVPGPSFPGPAPYLRDIAHSASNDVWAVGGFKTTAEALILHWDGVQWSQIDAPNLQDTKYGLASVTAISPTAAWAVGWYQGDTTTHGLVLYWDGETWSKASVPGAWSTGLSDISYATADHVWAVGDTNNVALLFWNGDEWLNRTDDIVGFGFIDLNQVDVRGIDDVYVAGRMYEEDILYAGVAHWDGTEWKIVTEIEIEDPTLPYYENTEYAAGMKAFSSTDIWLNLNKYGPSHYVPTHRMVRWNGGAWETIESGTGTTQDMDTSAPGLVYTVFDVINWGRAGYWDGATWNEFSLPLPKGDLHPFWGVDVISADEVWIVGEAYNLPNKNQPYIAHGASPCAVPPKPKLLSPDKGQILQRTDPTLKWNFTPGANSFEVILKQVHAPTVPVITADVQHAKFKPTAPLTPGQSYKWRVRACNNNGCGVWTRARTFTIAAMGP